MAVKVAGIKHVPRVNIIIVSETNTNTRGATRRRDNVLLRRVLPPPVTWPRPKAESPPSGDAQCPARTHLAERAATMLRRSLVASVGSYGSRRQRRGLRGLAAGLTGPRGGGGLRDASTSATTAQSKVKTMDDLGGPTFMATLYWLFIKGHFKTAHQMQVSAQTTLHGHYSAALAAAV